MPQQFVHAGSEASRLSETNAILSDLQTRLELVEAPSAAEFTYVARVHSRDTGKAEWKRFVDWTAATENIVTSGTGKFSKLTIQPSSGNAELCAVTSTQEWVVQANDTTDEWILVDNTNSKSSLKVAANTDTELLHLGATAADQLDVGGKMLINHDGTQLVTVRSSTDSSSQIQLQTNSTNRRLLARNTAGTVQAQIGLEAEAIHLTGATYTSPFGVFDATGLDVAGTLTSDMPAYSIKLRNAGTTGDSADTKISALTEELTPATGDWILGELSTGELRKYDVNNLPGGGGGGINAVVDDTSPQLGGQLDVNGFAIGDGTRALLEFVEDASAVNNWEMENEATGGGPVLRPTGSDLDIDAIIEIKGTGTHVMESAAESTKLSLNNDNQNWDVINNYVSGRLTFEISGVSVVQVGDTSDSNLLQIGVVADDQVDVNGDLDVSGDITAANLGVYFQVESDTTQTTTGTPADLTNWPASTLSAGGIWSWNDTTGVLTINQTGVFEFNAQCMALQSTGSNSTTLVLQLVKGASTVLETDANYTHLDTTNNLGSAQINGLFVSVTSGDTFKLRVYDIGTAVDVRAGDARLSVKRLA